MPKGDLGRGLTHPTYFLLKTNPGRRTNTRQAAPSCEISRAHLDNRPAVMDWFAEPAHQMAGFYPISTDGLKRAENFRSCLATLRRILGL